MEKTNLFQNNFALPHLVVCSFAPSKLKSITVYYFLGDPGCSEENCSVRRCRTSVNKAQASDYVPPQQKE